MIKDKKSLAATVLAAAVSLGSTSCIGFKVQSGISLLLSSGYNPESGRQLEVGAAVSQSIGEGSGTHSLRVGFLAGKMPPEQDENSRLEIGNIISEDVETSHGERAVLKFSLAYHNEAWGVRPYNWLALAALMGGGVEILSTYSTDRVRIGNSDSIEVPNLSIADKVKFFIEPAFEIRLGPKPYAVFPLRAGSKIFFNGCGGLGCVEPGLSVGYTIDWSRMAGGKNSEGDDNTCDYLPERKNIPLELLFEGKEGEKRKCRADYHQPGGGKHLSIELYSCRPKDCVTKYNSMVERENDVESGNALRTTAECYGEERSSHAGKETVLICNLYNKIFKGEVNSAGNFDGRTVLNDLANQVRDKVQDSLKK